VIIYLDASVVVALITKDIFSDRAEAFLLAEAPALILSDYAAAEFASVVVRRARTRELTRRARTRELTRRARTRELTRREAHAAFSALDQWAPRATTRVATIAADIAVAAAFIRRLDLPLRTPDAVNIAIAQRMAATLATFDVRMATSATALGVPIASL
jgi:predicted nucleic acid-binding protein